MMKICRLPLLSVVVLACFLSGAQGLSSKILTATNTQFQTGIFTVIPNAASAATTTLTNYPLTYTTAMATASLNASISILSIYFGISGNNFGWSITIPSLTATSMVIGAVAATNSNKVTFLRVCYLVSYHPQINVNSLSHTFNPASETVANTALPNLQNCVSTNCRLTSISGVPYLNINSNNVVNVFIGGFVVGSMGTIGAGDNVFGLGLTASGITSTSFTLNVLVNGQAQLTTILVYYVSYASGTIVSPLFVFQGNNLMGCSYSSSGCNPVFPITVSPSSNTTFTTVSTSFSGYSVALYCVGLQQMIMQYSGGGSTSGNFDLTSTSLSGTAYANSFLFTGNVNNLFEVGYNYFMLLTAYCPVTGDIYQVYGSTNSCNNSCNGGVGQYPDASNVCQLCSSVCFSCSSSPTLCLACVSGQNRVLSGSSCLCDPNGFYDNLVTLICPSCSYTCATCSGGSVSNCLSCSSSNFRTLLVNACPCNPNYYDNGGSMCLACSYTCLTCTTSGNSNCITCNSALNRLITTAGTCGCAVGYYEAGVPLCATCVYSCLTCSNTATQCLTCSPTAPRIYSGGSKTCPCQAGYYDAGVVTCLACDPTCLTCTGGAPTNCLTCNPTLHRFIVLNTCPCGTGYYNLLNVCYPCYYTCYNCTDGLSTSCTNCNTAVTARVYSAILGTCTCPNGYVDIGVSTCSACAISCLTCNPTQTACTSCNPLQFRTLSGSSCPCNTGYVDMSLVNGFCSTCAYSCTTCTGINTNQCTSCPAGSLRTISVPVGSCLCPGGYYDNGFTVLCQPCNAQCLTCNNQYNTSCLSCDITLQRTILTGQCPCAIGFYDNGPLLCAACTYSCYTCSIVSNNCTSCNPTRFITTSNTCACIGAYYQAFTALCLACATPCQNCSSLPNSCTSCFTGWYLSGTSCLCNPGTYLSSVNICSPCYYYCATCITLSTTCVTCPALANRYQLGSTCPCLSGYYDNAAVVCLLCPYSCTTCSGPSPPYCLTCPINSFRTFQPTGVCTCNPGYYDNGASPVCVACNATCATCASFSICTSCLPVQFRTLSGSTCACNSGYYNSTTNVICQPCDPSCLTCFGGTTFSCYSCQVNRGLTLSNSCPCLTGFYDASGTCYACNINCYTCTVVATQCTSCNSASYLSGTVCLCNSGYYANGNICSLCDMSCQTCITTSTTCLSCNTTRMTVLSGTACLCPPGTYPDVVTGICLLCNPICLTCSSYSVCLSCDSTLSLTLSLTQCVCNPGFYPIVNVCTACNSVCATCNGGSNLNCTSCPVGVTLIGSSCISTVVCANYYYSGQCVAVCPSTTYPVGNTCAACINSCLTCSSATVCLSCVLNYFYDPILQTCLLACALGQYALNFICLNCPSPCAQCALRSGLIECSKCIAGAYVLNGNCSLTCPTPTYVVFSSLCVPCLQGCATCVSLSSGGCLSCNLGYALYSGMCLVACPAGYNAINLVCLSCDPLCAICNSTGCQLCIANYYLSLDGICLPNGFYLSNGTNIACHPNCATCTNSSFSSCIKCNRLRGDTAQMAITGYCDCQVGSIDLGNGQCDTVTYASVLSANLGMVSGMSATNYFAILSGTLCANPVSPVLTLLYQQLYSNFYYLNSSAVMQTDEVLNQLQSANLNRFMHEPTTSTFGRLLVSTQMNESLFMRGSTWEYLSDWSAYSMLVILLVWIWNYLSYRYLGNKVAVDGESAPIKKHSVRDYVSRLRKITSENLIIMLHLLTITEASLYAAASFKILILEGKELVIFKLVLSCLEVLYYLGYIIRLILVCRKNGQPKQQFSILSPNPLRNRVACRLYLPILMIRNILMGLSIVFLSSVPPGQALVSVGVFVIWMVYSMVYCPYPTYARVFIHLHEVLFLAQLFLLSLMTLYPQTSRIVPAEALVAVNFAQVVVLAGLGIAVILKEYTSLECLKKEDIPVPQNIQVKSAKDPVQDSHLSMVFQGNNRDQIQDSIPKEFRSGKDKTMNQSDLNIFDVEFEKGSHQDAEIIRKRYRAKRKPINLKAFE